MKGGGQGGCQMWMCLHTVTTKPASVGRGLVEWLQCRAGTTQHHRMHAIWHSAAPVPGHACMHACEEEHAALTSCSPPAASSLRRSRSAAASTSTPTTSLSLSLATSTASSGVSPPPPLHIHTHMHMQAEREGDMWGPRKVGVRRGGRQAFRHLGILAFSAGVDTSKHRATESQLRHV